jgi:hypothetical protein
VFLDPSFDIPNTVAARPPGGGLGAELSGARDGGRAMVRRRAAAQASGGDTHDRRHRAPSLDGYALPGFATRSIPASWWRSSLTWWWRRAGTAGVLARRAANGPPVRRPESTPTPASIGQPARPGVATIAQAVGAGSSLLVLGRAVTGAADPRAALERARSEREEAAGRLPAPAAQP